MNKSNGPVLVLDAASATSLVAVAANDIIIEHKNTAKMGQAGKLTESLVELLEEAELDVQNLSTIIAGVGPGSFTGIRICLATALGLQSGTSGDGPILKCVDSFDVQYSAFKRLHPDYHAKTVLVLVDSKRPDMFAQIYHPLGQKNGEPFLVQADGLSDQAVDVITGDGVSRVSTEQFLSLAPIVLKTSDYLVANDLNVKQNKSIPAKPFYLRPPDVGPSNTNLNV